MTKDEALKMAIKALDALKYYDVFVEHDVYILDKNIDLTEALNACKEALEQPAQEPVAFINVEQRTFEWNGNMYWHDWFTPTVVVLDKIPLYTHPHQDGASPSGARDKEFVTLTDDEIGNLITPYEYSVHPDLDELARAIEQALKEKNHV